MATIKDTKRDKFKHSDAALDKRHGDAKKGGAGRHGWGRPGDEAKDLTVFSKRDPNYDSGAEDDYVPPVINTKPEQEVQQNFKDSFEQISRFKNAVQLAMQEYLLSFDEAEFVRCVTELHLPIYHHELPKIAIIAAIDKNEEQRKRVCGLLEVLSEQQIVTKAQMETGFCQVFNRLADLTLDSPHAESVLKQFLLRAVSAGFLSEAFADSIGEGTEKLRNQQDVSFARERIRQLVAEYFSNEDLAEAERQIIELKEPHFHHMLVKHIISAAMDRTNRERELASYLISTLASSQLKLSEIEKGFEMLLYRVDDLVKDVPKALELLSAFVARAIADECLPPAFLTRTNLPPDDLGGKVIKQAEVLLNKKPHGFARLDNIWGPGDGRSVPQLKKIIRDSLAEFFESGDLDEAAKCVTDLNAPFFLHEVVKRLFVLAVDKKEREHKLAAQLLRKLKALEILSPRQYNLGVARVEAALPDLELDSPGAGVIVQQIKAEVAAKP